MTDRHGSRGKMHTTTVRFDADVWALIVAHCERLGIAYGEFIRGAVLLRLGSLLLETHRADELDLKVATLARRLERLVRLIERIATFVGFVAPRSSVRRLESHPPPDHVDRDARPRSRENAGAAAAHAVRGPSGG